MAEKFREEQWRNRSLPVDIEKIIESNLGLSIEPTPDLLSVYDIDAYLRVDLTGIVVDENQYMDDRFANRLRFSFAHELGHLFLHKEIYEKFGISSLEKWQKFMSQISEREYGNFEFQANEFAGRVLVPRDRLIQELGKCIEILEENGLKDILVRDPGSALEYISNALCKPFGISSLVIQKRVEREELWPPKR